MAWMGPTEVRIGTYTGLATEAFRCISLGQGKYEEWQKSGY